jgi:error-prone DNA polymerase
VRELERTRTERPFSGFLDFLARTRIPSGVLHRLALSDAFSCFGISPRDALWEILAQEMARESASQPQLNLFDRLETSSSRAARFDGLDDYESIQADYRAFGLSNHGHPMQVIRPRTPGLPRWTAKKVRQAKPGENISIGGLFIVRQRPPTAKGTTFATLEDETGLLDLLMHRETYEKFQDLYWEHAFLIVSGKVQREGQAVSLLVTKLRVFPRATASASNGGYHPRNLRVVM